MSLGSDVARLHLVVRGRVQGVFFRYSTEEEARMLGLKGWVRNRLDGAVEIVAEGRRRNLEILAAWAHQGPPYARVDHVEEEWLSPTGEFTDFRIR